MKKQRRVIFYSHDSQGLGHLRRNLAIAQRIVADAAEGSKGIAGLLVTGLVPQIDFLLPSGFDWLSLPGITKKGACYEPRYLSLSRREVTALRSALLTSAFVSFAPDLVIVDRHILGVKGELREPLLALRAAYPSARIVLGLREILDEPGVVREEWDRVRESCDLNTVVDEVWVYGDPKVHNPLLTGEVPPELHSRTRFTGYLAHGRNFTTHLPVHPSEVKPPFILTTVGGGSDAEQLVRNALALTPPEGYQHLVIAGPQFPANTLYELQAHTGERTVLMAAHPQVNRLIQEASAVIAMGGYNTVCEILASTTPALIIPREYPRTEQLIRARALSATGAVDFVRHNQADPHTLEQWVNTAVHAACSRDQLALDGLRYAVEYAHQALAIHQKVGASA